MYNRCQCLVFLFFFSLLVFAPVTFIRTFVGVKDYLQSLNLQISLRLTTSMLYFIVKGVFTSSGADQLPIPEQKKKRCIV